MKKVIIILLLFSAFNIKVTGADTISRQLPRVTFGAEWGYVATFFSYHSYNYFSTEGYRMSEKHGAFGIGSNGEVNLHIGYNLNHHWNIALYAGFTGLMNIHNAVPVSIRATRYFGNFPEADRWLAFIDLGSGISIKREPQELATAKLGAGYRISLSRDTKLDFIAAVRLTHTHPQIIDEGDLITLEWTNRNSAFLTAVSVGMSLTF